MNQIAVREEQSIMVSSEKMTAMLDFAGQMIKSGFLPQSIKTAQQAVAIILTGQELGIAPMQALRQINVIQGKPTMSAELMLSLAYSRIPGFKFKVIRSDDTTCVVEAQRPGGEPYKHEFSMEDASKMGLNNKDNWRKQPAVMLRWRCISAALRIVAPDAIAGVYSSEEINPNQSVDYETGEILETKAPLKEPMPVIEPEIVRDPLFSQEEYVSEAQAKKMFALAREGRIDLEDLKDYLMREHSIQSSQEIPRSKYDEILQWIKSNSTVTKGAANA